MNFCKRVFSLSLALLVLVIGYNIHKNGFTFNFNLNINPPRPIPESARDFLDRYNGEKGKTSAGHDARSTPVTPETMTGTEMHQRGLIQLKPRSTISEWDDLPLPLSPVGQVGTIDTRLY